MSTDWNGAYTVTNIPYHCFQNPHLNLPTVHGPKAMLFLLLSRWSIVLDAGISRKICGFLLCKVVHLKHQSVWLREWYTTQGRLKRLQGSDEEYERDGESRCSDIERRTKKG